MGFAGKLFQKGKMRARIFASGRNAHEALYDKAVLLAATLHEGNGFLRWNAGLLRFQAGIDLHIEFRALALFPDLAGQGGCDLLAVHRFNGVERATASAALLDCRGPIR